MKKIIFGLLFLFASNIWANTLEIPTQNLNMELPEDSYLSAYPFKKTDKMTFFLNVKFHNGDQEYPVLYFAKNSADQICALFNHYGGVQIVDTYEIFIAEGFEIYAFILGENGQFNLSEIPVDHSEFKEIKALVCNH